MIMNLNNFGKIGPKTKTFWPAPKIKNVKKNFYYKQGMTFRRSLLTFTFDLWPIDKLFTFLKEIWQILNFKISGKFARK